jgi:hypothetical protein
MMEHAAARIRRASSARRITFEVVVAFGAAKFAPAGGTPILRHLHLPDEFEKPRLASHWLIDRSPNQRSDIITRRITFED